MATAGTLRGLAARLGDGSLSAEALVRTCLDRVDEREAEVQAWAWLDPDAVLAAARAVDGAAEKDPLHGIPFGIKDVIDTADMPTGHGSPIYDGHRPVADAAAVAAIRGAGGIILGKTVSCEFAGGLPSKTRNPLAPDRTPGGSSSGSAAAVAAGMVPVALGTQTAGSIIRPASFCGVVGYKPTYGLINRAGLKPLSESVDTIGLFARCVDDAGWAAAAIAKRPELAEDGSLARPPRLLLCRTDKWSVADADGQRALERASGRLAEAGADIVDDPLPFSCGALIAAGMIVIATDARRAFGHELRSAPELLSDKMRNFLAMGESGRSDRYDAAQAALGQGRGAFDLVFGDVDALVTLSAPGEAPGLETTGNATFCVPWSMLHAPAISVPGLAGSNGLPIGIQLVGRRGADAQLLRVARWAEPALAAG